MARSIKTPLSSLIVGTALITTILVLWLGAYQHESLFKKTQQSHLFALNRTLSIDLAPILEEQELDRYKLQTVGRKLAPYQHVIYVRVFDKDYNPVITLEGRAAKPKEDFGKILNRIDPKKQHHTVVEQDGILLSFDRVGDAAFPIGYLLILADVSAPLAQSYADLLVRLIPLLLLILLAVCGIGLVLMQRTLRPFYHLSMFTMKVNETKDYSMRFSEKSSKEVNHMAAHINQFLSTIETEWSLNQAQNETLRDQQSTMMRLANYDNLTRLPNRQFVMDALRQELLNAQHHQQDIALMYFDLDGFKGINDSLGHETGDLILVEVAERVNSILREGDLLARLGGDEFIIVPDRDTSEASLTNVAHRILLAFNDPFHLRGLALKVGVSIGIAKASDANYQLSQLISNADLAMYRSKAQGRGRFTIFNVDMVVAYKRKMHIANSIDNGLRADEFSVYYQPKVAADGTTVGVEALMRWQHPELGAIMPSEFIPIAEQGGKIASLTQWVIKRVCQELPALRQHFSRRFRVGINLSGHDLRHADLFDSIYKLFVSYDVNPAYIEFEVTESAYLENFDASNKFFRRIANMGCAIALDDFGTGYSSLSYLTQITIDTLKIDRQFVEELETSERSRMVTGTIIDLAKRLSLSICAEGIETPAQLHYLLEQGCDTTQGYLFSRPLPLHELILLPEVFTPPY